MKCPPIEIASVKVMRSHDYCHFEVCLSTSSVSCRDDVDNLRKEAARLADKAVEQYKVAKKALAQKEEFEQKWLYDAAMRTPENERSIQEKAVIKYVEDKAFAARFDYDYQDDWDDDYDS